ncbi:hypothetical protein BD410DRAFT_895698 [Rickenella mellea]|uniref:Methyltransferase type 11 domain-containing protein n=1 Tax=Rickenella mellea TaxID=50990 RepID=A0A4Y7QF68_9AGAM|nr:hypothetical protein BD410DRAFT_895698 [Rickenella mellea]
MITDKAKDSNYVLFRGESETNRLNRQYNVVKKVLGRTNALPSSINSKGLSKVLDIAAGSLVWTLDLARTPDISTRLSPESRDPIYLYACDISSAQFPPVEETRKLGITTFLHDMTKPFPEDMKGTFDLVNMRLLVLGLSEQGWEKAIRNIYEILKPGGLLLIFDFNTHFVRQGRGVKSEKYEAEVSKEPFESYTQDWRTRTNAIMDRSCIDVNGFIPDLANGLPSMLAKASFQQESYAAFEVPVGAAATRQESGKVQLSGDEGNFLAENYRLIYDAVWSGALKKGVLQGVDGPIDTEEGRLAALDETFKGFSEEGAFIWWVEIVAKRI